MDKQKNAQIKVALLLGGWSVERMVSLTKGKAVEAALIEAGFDVHVVDVRESLSKLMVELENIKPDVVFNNLYGKGGEDGTIQAILELLNIPYTHSGVQASAIAMDKPMTKAIARGIGINVADELICSKAEITTQQTIKPPFVIKPKDEGSSVGIYMIGANGKNMLPKIQAEWPFEDKVMIETFIPGEELTVAVLDGKAQGVTKIISKQDFFDYQAKYVDTDTVYELPASVPKDVYARAMADAEKLYAKLGCRGIARCDFRYDDKQGVDGVYLLEINTQPGLTAESIGPSQVIYNGSSFAELCTHLIEDALCYDKQKHDRPSQSQAASQIAG
ncbi:MAG: D-alanine--D-alanine ligase [Alphaproteobacteria bacterium]|nr:D-alanine--D-alanine ligase [Alphaproteobacteria bacterium]|tara:strand:- start:517034 stop:518029 length:996 start_codon:yes stop_codon:yes gene_type:complete